MTTDAQLRMARAAVRWTVRALAERSGVHRNTITRLESGGVGEARTMAILRRTFEAAGIVFLEENGQGSGVRLKMAGIEEGMRPEELNSANDG